MITKRSYPGEASSVQKARRFVMSSLAGVPQELQEAVVLMVSELATNAVRHTGTDFTICVEIANGTVRVEVTDPGAGMPVRRSPGPTDPSGRGLRIVETLAGKWGVLPASPNGKTVWFTLPVERSGSRHQ